MMRYPRSRAASVLGRVVGSALLGAPVPGWALDGQRGPALTPDLGEHAAQMLLGLVVVLAAIGVLAWLARRFLRIPRASGGPVRIVSALAIGPREKIVLLEVGETQLLVGIAPGRIQTLHVLESPVPAAAIGFASHLEGRFAERMVERLWARGSKAAPGRRT